MHSTRYKSVSFVYTTRTRPLLVLSHNDDDATFSLFNFWLWDHQQEQQQSFVRSFRPLPLLTNSIQQAPPSAAVGLHWCRAKNQNHVFMESLHSILPSSTSSRNSMRESWPPSYGKDDDAAAAMVKSPSRQWCLTVRLVLVWSGCTTSNHFHSSLLLFLSCPRWCTWGRMSHKERGTVCQPATSFVVILCFGSVCTVVRIFVCHELNALLLCWAGEHAAVLAGIVLGGGPTDCDAVV